MGKTIEVFGFPYLVSAELVTKFLEGITGQGTVYAVEVKQSKGGPRAYAKVQFADDRSAERIIRLAQQRLHYGSSYLRAWEKDRDMVPRARTYVHHMEQIILNFGCQVSKNKFSVLWNVENVSVKFGIGMRKMYFFLCIGHVYYKLELFYKNIRQIILHRPGGQGAKNLLIQLNGAPRIFKKLEGSIYSFSKEIPDDQWVRTTDFTPSCIGQSSSICLELPRGIQLPNFSDYFAWYKEVESQFILETGLPYSYNLVSWIYQSKQETIYFDIIDHFLI